jgi:omega-3 fatty acid desaturase (delta-15 desaturase)
MQTLKAEAVVVAATRTTDKNLSPRGEESDEDTEPLQRLNMPRIGEVKQAQQRQQEGYDRSNDGDYIAYGKLPSLVEIKRAIPKHCFEPSLFKSLRYVLQDMLVVCVLFVVMRLVVDPGNTPSCSVDDCFSNWSYSKLFRILVAWPCYWFLMGTWMWAIFVLAHDCGHGSFSKYAWINSVVGTLLDSLLLVPFWPWRLTHNHHHKNTGNMDKDEVFFPVFEPPNGFKKSSWALFFHTKVYFGLGIAWLYYIVFGYSPFNSNPPSSFFSPSSPLFILKGKYFEVISSMVCTAMVLMITILYGYYDGFSRMVMYYYVPLFVFASWLVVTTFLHHGTKVPWYVDHAWDYVRGNLSSIDRDYGIFQSITHNIGTHQVHHLFPAIPHYHLQEATRHFRQQFPHLVRKSDDRILYAFHDNFVDYASHFEKINPEKPTVFMYHNNKKNQ